MRNFILGLVLGFGLGVSVMSQLPPGENTLEPSLQTAAVVEHELGGPRSQKEVPIVVSGMIYAVAHVTDGDTVNILIDGRKVPLRLIGISAPETGKNPQNKKECFGEEARMRAKALLEYKRVRVETDPSQDTHDRFERQLVYVFTEDGLFFNRQMIAEGYAKELTFRKRKPYKYQSEFKSLEEEAIRSQKGLWGACGVASQ